MSLRFPSGDLVLQGRAHGVGVTGHACAKVIFPETSYGSSKSPPFPRPCPKAPPFLSAVRPQSRPRLTAPQASGDKRRTGEHAAAPTRGKKPRGDRDARIAGNLLELAEGALLGGVRVSHGPGGSLTTASCCGCSCLGKKNQFVGSSMAVRARPPHSCTH